MAFEDFKSKDHISLVYTGEGKGKTTASLGLLVRALGAGDRVAFIQFIKHWDVSEHAFLSSIIELYEDQLTFVKYGRGFYDAGELSADGVSDEQHQEAAEQAYGESLNAIKSGDYELVVCDEINNAVHDGLLTVGQLETLIDAAKDQVSLCLTGRDFPQQLLDTVDIATNMTKLRHHFDDGFIANKGIDY
jgi:cob(I)alamin adenosyltransferase